MEDLRLLPDHFVLIETARNGGSDSVEATCVSVDGENLVINQDSWAVSLFTSAIDQRYFFIYGQNLRSVLVRSTTTGLINQGTFAQIWICRGSRSNFTKIAVLNSGYINQETPLEYPVVINDREARVPLPVFSFAHAPAAGAPAVIVNNTSSIKYIDFIEGNVNIAVGVANGSFEVVAISPGPLSPQTYISSITHNGPLGVNFHIDKDLPRDVYLAPEETMVMRMIELRNGGICQLWGINFNAGTQIANCIFWYRERIVI